MNNNYQYKFLINFKSIAYQNTHEIFYKYLRLNSIKTLSLTKFQQN